MIKIEEEFKGKVAIIKLEGWLDTQTTAEFAKEIENRGYKLVPSVQKQVDAFREKQDKIEEMEAQLDAINSALVTKNKRQKRFFENAGKRAVNKIRKLRNR